MKSVPESPAKPDAAAVPLRPTEPAPPAKPIEIGGRKGPEPTRYGDWENGGKCVDF